MTAVIEWVAPRRLGSSFRWLLGSSWITNLGDGVVLAAGPLLVASRTDEPFLVALAAMLQWLPPLLFGLWAGVLTDRLDRRRLVVLVNLARGLVMGLLALAVATDVATIALVLAAMFLLGTAETFADNATQAMVPMLVQRADLTVANARLTTGMVTLNQLAGPPVGAALFAIGQALPFAANTMIIVLGAVLVSRARLPDHGDPAGTRPRRVLEDVVEGVRWVLHHPAVRTLVLTILIFNVTFGAAWSVLVLYASERLGMGPVGFGLITTVGALGGALGIVSYGWLTARITLAGLMRIGLIIETLTHLALALTTVPWVALIIFFVFGAHAFVWGTTSVTIRQRVVPSRLQGRVGSVNLIGTTGGLVLGAAIGGLLAQRFGVTAPFWFAFVGSAVFVVLIWRELRHIAHTDEAMPPDEATGSDPGGPGSPS